MHAGEPLAGSAPYALGWIVVEEPGPWGRNALRDSPLPDSIGEACEELLERSAVRTILARHATRRKLGAREPRNVWLAHASADTRAWRHILVDSMEQILEWDLAGIAEGKVPQVGSEPVRPVEFICTHSRRDRCCAIFGRARAIARPDSWECSHLGGHRFAATSLLLPTGQLFGRLGATDADDMTTASMRGASYLSPAEQVADIAVREHIGADIRARMLCRQRSATPTETVIDVQDPDGHSWSVTCRPQTYLRASSCGSDDSPATAWIAVAIHERN